MKAQRAVAGIGRHIGNGSLGGVLFHQPAVIRHHFVGRADHVDGQRHDIALRQRSQQKQREQQTPQIPQRCPEIGFDIGFHNASLDCTTCICRLRHAPGPATEFPSIRRAQVSSCNHERTLSRNLYSIRCSTVFGHWSCSAESAPAREGQTECTEKCAGENAG